MPDIHLSVQDQQVLRRLLLLEPVPGQPLPSAEFLAGVNALVP